MCGVYPICGVRHSSAFSKSGVGSVGNCVWRSEMVVCGVLVMEEYSVECIELD